MKKFCSPLAERKTALGLAIAAATISAAFWLNNLVSALQYHAALFRGTQSAANGILPFLRWSAADVSTVSTFIPFFGFLLIARGIYRVRNTDDWPFFEGYDRFNVALGLIGTLWGIILIGYYPAKEISVEALMKCLHTAMFSTLVSVIWVMVLEPVLFRPWLNGVRKNTLRETEEDATLQESVNAFFSGIERGSQAVREMSQSAAIFRDELQELNASLHEVRTAEAERARETLECLKSIKELLNGFQAMTDQLTIERKELLREKERLEEKLSDARSELQRAQAQLTEAVLQAETFRQESASAQQANGELAAKNAELAEQAKNLNQKLADLAPLTAQLDRQLSILREAMK